MSKERALKAIQLQPTDLIPNWEFLSNPSFEHHLTGIDPYQQPQRSAIRMVELLDLDVAPVPETNDPIPPAPQSGEDGQGHRVARWGASASWRWDWGDAFETEEQVLAYQPLEHLDLSQASIPGARDYGMSFEKLVETFQTKIDRSQGLLGERALSDASGFYNTFFMWPLLTFGWELFLSTAMHEPQTMARIMADFGQISLKVFAAWAEVAPPLFVSHDDICYTNGPVFSPRWLRQNIYPWYERLWEPLRRKGVKVIFMSDGNIDRVVDDVFACGADGIVAEPYTNLADIARRYPEKILIGNIDNRVLERGSRNEIYAEVERCARLGKDCPGYFFSVSNHITYNLPIDSVHWYFDACEKFGRR